VKYLKRIGRSEPVPPWGLLTAIVAPLAAFISVLIGISIASILLPDQPSRFIVGYGFGMLLVIAYVLVTRARSLQDRAALGLADDRPAPLMIIFLLAIAIALTIDVIGLALVPSFLPTAELFGFFDLAQSPIASLDVGLLGWGFALIVMGLFQPIGEELIFRGIVFPRLKQSLGNWSGYLFTSVMYAVFHLLAYAPAGGATPSLIWYTLAVPFLDSLFITLVRANTRSTRAAMVAHAGIGIFSVLRAFIIAG